MIRISKLILATLIFLISGQVYACGFKTVGITSRNEANVKRALSTITTDFDLDIRSGDLYFKTKEVVSLEQVKSALKAAEIIGVTVLQSTHH